MNRIREERMLIKKTQKEIASLIGIERTTYVKYETGAIQPTVEMAIKLSDIFRVSLDYLFCRSDIRTSDSSTNETLIDEDEINLVNNYRNLNDQGKEYIRQTMYMAATIYIKHSDVPNLENTQIG